MIKSIHLYFVILLRLVLQMFQRQNLPLFYNQMLLSNSWLLEPMPLSATQLGRARSILHRSRAMWKLFGCLFGDSQSEASPGIDKIILMAGLR